MRLETTVWMSAALVVVTTALHLPIENNFHTDQTSPAALDTPTQKATVHMVHGPEELVISAQTNADETENASEEHFSGNLIGSDSSSSPSKSQENENLPNPDSASDSLEPGNSNSKSSGTSQEDDSESSDNRSNPPDENPNTGETGEETDNDSTTSTAAETPTTPESQTTDSEEDNTDTTPGPDASVTTNVDETTASETEETTPVLGDQSTSPVPGENGDHSTPEPPDTIVATTTGRVRGHVWRKNENILSYIDIKYGTFSNYFEAAVFPEEVVDASVHDEELHSKRCPQLQGEKIVGDSDCLTLSIFKPFKPELSGASVLVHIHEGNFINESANPDIYGPEYLVPQDIILILPNYRLGPLGFLCLQNETAPGNAALKDLALALSWIKANIESFGGDPDNIAVSGEGTAGALAGYLALSPMSKNNVNKVITESGSVLSHWAIDRNPIDSATNLATRITGSWESWQTIPIEELLVAARGIAWRPCFENNTDDGVHFIVETPWSMLQKEDINVTFMIGSAQYAGVHESLTHTAASIQQLNANTSLLLPNDLQFESSVYMNRVGDKVKEQYFGPEAITMATVKNRTLYYTDMAYLGPGIRTARSLANSGSTVYFYEFSFVGDLNRELEAVQKQVEGAVRGDIIGYLFYQEGSMPPAESKEDIMIKQLLEFWTSFLRTGTPKAEGIDWIKFEKTTAAQEQWLSIGKEIVMKRGVHLDRLGVWTEIYNEHFVDSPAVGLSPSVYTVLVLQGVFFITFFRNAWHFF